MKNRKLLNQKNEDNPSAQETEAAALVKPLSKKEQKYYQEKHTLNSQREQTNVTK